VARDILPYNYLKQAQFNAVVLLEDEEMDWVGVEPTTSAYRQHSQAAVYPLFFITYLKEAAMERELYNEIPLGPFLLFWENTALNHACFRSLSDKTHLQCLGQV
jgi:hypothetical protein